MTRILSRRTPVSPGGDEAAFATVTEMFAMVQRSNHATAFAAWVVTTSTMGLVLQWDRVQPVIRSPLGIGLLAALVPVAAAATYVVALLVRAHGVTAAAQEDFYRYIATVAPDAPEFTAPALRRLQLLTAATRHRAILTRTALVWAYVSGLAFLGWSVVTLVMTSGR